MKFEEEAAGSNNSTSDDDDVEPSTFITDRYIQPSEWNNPLAKAWISNVAIPVRKITESETFNNTILGAIIIAGILVGVQTYDGMETNLYIITIDFIILVTFCIEWLFKMISEGLAPWRFFTGIEYKWNNFDATIIVMCMPGFPVGSSVALLRLLRLMRLAKLVRKVRRSGSGSRSALSTASTCGHDIRACLRWVGGLEEGLFICSRMCVHAGTHTCANDCQVPALQMIIMGLVGGLGSIGYILLLLFLVFYLFAIAGIYAFRDNDPWHWGDLFTALLTLFRGSTLEDWTDLMYINMFGCEQYPSIYVSTEARVTDNEHRWCTYPTAKNFLTQLFFVFFIVVSAMVMLSLFIGAVTMSMTESMEEMKAEDAEKAKKKMKEKQEKKIAEQKRMRSQASALREGGSSGGGERTSERNNRSSRRMSTSMLQASIGLGNPEVEKLEEANQMQKLLVGAWDGVDLTDLMDDEKKTFSNPLRQKYHDFSHVAHAIAYDHRFVNFITLVIILAGALVGLQTYDGYGEVTTEIVAENGDKTYLIECKTSDCEVVGAIDFVILLIFTVEIGLKFIAEDNTPLKVMLDAWNAFDFLIVLGSWTLGGGMITMLRLLRLLRVLKLVKAFPQLQVIVQALMMGMASIGYIGVILVLVFYVFAIIGMILFKENDPWHFGTLHFSMLSLFRAATFEDWTDIMYINMYGCDQYGYSSMSDQCVAPKPTGAIAAIYFVIFVIIGGMVLLTLFIGVVTTSMDEVQQAQKEEQEMEEKVLDLQKAQNLEDVEIELYRKVFAMLDLDGGGTIEEEELRVGLQAVGKNPSDAELTEMLIQVDEDESGEIDLVEFMQFMVNLRKEREGVSTEQEQYLGTVYREKINVNAMNIMRESVGGKEQKSDPKAAMRAGTKIAPDG